MSMISGPDYDLAQMPSTSQRRQTNVLVVSSVALSFISFWKAAAIVLCDLASTAYYIGGISEQAIGKAAPWFILGVMLFSYAVRAVYVESCTMFTRGGVYKVVKGAMGGNIAKLSVSALMFDYILTGPISAVSAGQYLVGLFSNMLAILPGKHPIEFNATTHPDAVALLSMLIAIGITLYFWRANLIGIGESSDKALKIMKLTSIMGVIIIIWCLLTLAIHPELCHLPTWHPVFTAESSGWLQHVPRVVGALGIIVAFGHSLLAMSGEESLAQVNRELEAPKLLNLKKAGFVIFCYSMLLTSLISFFAVMIIPDKERMLTTVVAPNGMQTEVQYVQPLKGPDGQNHLTGIISTKNGLPDKTFQIREGSTINREEGVYTENLISGLAMNVVGPRGLKLVLQAFVVFVGFLILAGAVNTSLVGSNGVLNRLAEDGVLVPDALKPHHRYGTTYRLINFVAILQLFTILASRGDVYTLGEAYAFGVIWSFVFMTLAMVALRFKDKSHRLYEVPGNIKIHRNGERIDLPIGILTVFLILISTAGINLLTKKTATIWGCGFTAAFLIVFVICETISNRRRGGVHHEFLEQFNQKNSDRLDIDALGLTHPNPIVVAARGPRSLPVLDKILHEIDTNVRDLVVLTCKVLPAMTLGVTDAETSVNDEDRALLTKIVKVAEEVGKQVYPVVLPTNNPLYAIASAARDLKATEVVLGVSEKVHAEEQLEQFALAWGSAIAEMSGEEPALTVRIIGPQIEMKCEMA
jgi:hypothetical protein